MTTELQILHNGHLARLALRKFAECPEDFDDDSTEEIWQHLDVCDECMDEYDTVRKSTSEHEKHDKPVSQGVVTEPGAFSPEELATVKKVVKHDDGTHIDGLMPVGDEPTRSEDSDEDDFDDGGASDVDDVDKSESDDDSPMEGLITGELPEPAQPATRVQTETLADEEERMTKDNIKAHDEPNIWPDIKTEAADDVEDAVDEPDDAETEITTEAPDDVEVTDSAPPDEPTVPESPVSETDEEPRARDQEIKDVPRPPARTSKPRHTSRPKPAGRPRTPTKTKSEPLEDLIKNVMAFMRRPRNLIICCGAAAVTAAALVTFFVMAPAPEKASPVSGWAPLDVIESRVPLQEVRIRRMSNGKIPEASGTDITLDFRRVNNLVIAVDLDFIKGKTSPHWLTVFDPAGESVFRDQIPQIYVDDGRFFLRLIPKLFEQEQTYKLRLSSQLADGRRRVIAESVFDVVK